MTVKVFPATVRVPVRFVEPGFGRRCSSPFRPAAGRARGDGHPGRVTRCRPGAAGTRIDGDREGPAGGGDGRCGRRNSRRAGRTSLGDREGVAGDRQRSGPRRGVRIRGDAIAHRTITAATGARADRDPCCVARGRPVSPADAVTVTDPVAPAVATLAEPGEIVGAHVDLLA